MYKNVLIIDDDQISNFIVNKTLTKMGVVKVRFAKNGFDGIEMVKNDVPDLIILDINMPIMDGFDFMNVMNTELSLVMKNTKIIVLSVSNVKTDVKLMMDLGVKWFFNKPLTEQNFEQLKSIETGDLIIF